MIKKEDVYSFYQTVVSAVFGDISQLAAMDNWLLSSLGGRVCYSKESPISILSSDARVNSPKERKSYLERIRQKHHYSIFAHSPMKITIDVGFSGLYKTYEFLDLKTFDCFEILNGRHYVELLGVPVNIEDTDESDLHVIIYSEDGRSEQSLQSFISGEVEEPDSPYLLVLLLPIPYYGYWISAIAHGYSRVFSHQLVRHTWFNFSQRSFRYTNTFGVNLPDSLKNLFDDPNFECAQNYDQCYWELINTYKARKEDARYLYPMGAKTTIMFSAPLFVFEDFAEKRKVKAAQKEIRTVANYIDDLLTKV